MFQNLFQKAVLKHHISKLNSKIISTQYEEFKKYFHSAIIQANIRNTKEEEYQEGFLRDLFVKILGYRLNPTENFNLVREKKNDTNSKKADGGILKNNKTLAVIELKSTKTADLKSIDEQAFGYKNNQEGCIYVITSTFEKLRFYIENTVHHAEFNLFTLTEENFKVLWLCLHSENLLSNLPLRIKKESVLNETEITKNLYKDYHNFRNNIFADIIKNNLNEAQGINKLTLFKKTQKLLDRFLFVLFAEDRGLLPANSIKKILDHWQSKIAFGESSPLYNTFKTYFKLLNTGREKQENREAIFPYNGGLFVADELLDNLKISNEILKTHTKKLSEYNFESDVSVDVLGHIFENSLNEIEEIKNELQGIETEKSSSKRKKDGVFYTPRHITKYIVENTLGKLCTEKKKEYGIREEKYTPPKNKTKTEKDRITALQQNLNNYKEWLLSVTVCDPACGSGAFLTAALEFLMNQHKNINELEEKILESIPMFGNIEKHILENNLYGVDINEESVEIAKLSLWLHTAKKGRKLTTLSNNIKCGNSLIEKTLLDAVAAKGEKSFRWQQQFPQVFESGGFDVVIGNPPYVQLQKIKNVSAEVKEAGYQTYEATGDLYCLFYEKAQQILKPYGLLGFITSNKWMRAGYGASMRKFFTSNTKVYQLVDLGSGVFDDATVDSNILCYENCQVEKQYINAINLSKEKTFTDFSVYEKSATTISPQGDASWVINSKLEQKLQQKIERIGTPLKEWDVQINYGIKTGYNEAFIVNDATRKKLIEEHPSSIEILKPILRGRDIKRYSAKFANLWLVFIPWNFPNTFNSEKKTFEENEQSFKQQYPAIYNHLLKHKSKLEKRNKAETGIRYEWYAMQRWAANYHEEFSKEKIAWARITQEVKFAYSEKGQHILDSMAFLSGFNSDSNYKYLLSILNSSLVYKWVLQNVHQYGETGFRLANQYVENIPIPKISAADEKPFIKLADEMLALHKNLQEIDQQFMGNLDRRFSAAFAAKKPSTTLEKWHTLSYNAFIAELAKHKIKLKLNEEAEWQPYFEKEITQANEIKNSIEKADVAINQMVYKLYNLTPEEIAVVEA